MHEHHINATRILGEWSKIAYADAADYFEIEDDTGATRCKGLNELEPGASRAIKRVRERRRILSAGEGDGDNMILEATLDYEFYSKTDALAALSKYKKIDGSLIMGNQPPEPETPEPEQGPRETEDLLRDIKGRIGK